MRFGDLGRIVLFCLLITISAIAQPAGTVRDTNGKPIAGAKLMLYSHQSEWGLDNEVSETVPSGADGAYHFTKKLQFKVPSGTTYNNYYIITASHPNYAFGWSVIVASEQQSKYGIVLTKPVSQTFIVKDENDNPVRGATVWIFIAGSPESAEPSLRKTLHLPTDIGLASATTDADGHATLTHLPDTALYFRASLKGYGDSYKQISKPRDKAVEFKLMPAGVVRGTVRNEDGEAVGGAIVAFSANWMSDYTLVRTNSDGQFEAAKLVARGGSWTKDGGDGTYKVTIRHPDYASQVMTVTLNPGQTIDNFDISAEKGSLLRVKVTDPETHDPVSGVRMQALIGENRLDGYTDNKGTIEWRTVPGQASVMFISPPGGTYVAGVIPSKSVTVEGDETEVVIQPPTPFKPLVGIRGRVVDADGKPASGVVVHAACSEQVVQTPDQYGYSTDTATADDGTYTIRGFPSSTKLCVYVETRDRKFAGAGEFDVSSVGGDLKDPIKLRATQSAEVDLQQVSGKAQPNRKMLISPVVGDRSIWHEARSAKTDEQSHLKLDGVLPGLSYDIEDAQLQTTDGRHTTEDLLEQRIQIIPAP